MKVIYWNGRANRDDAELWHTSDVTRATLFGRLEGGKRSEGKDENVKARLRTVERDQWVFGGAAIRSDRPSWSSEIATGEIEERPKAKSGRVRSGYAGAEQNRYRRKNAIFRRPF
jgi:hypothetical protein